MKIANNPLSRKLAEHFKSKGAERPWDGDPNACVQNDEFRREAARIKMMISEKYPLAGKERNAFSAGFFAHLIMPDPANPSNPWRNPLISNVQKICEVLGWNFNEVWIDSQTHLKLEELSAIKQKIIRAVETGTPRMITAINAMVDAFLGQGESEEKMIEEEPLHKEHPDQSF